MKTVFFTSMDQKYHDSYGINLVKSFRETMPNQKLCVYNEDFSIDDVAVTNMGWDLGADFDAFCERWHREKRVVTFAKKAFAVMHAMTNIDTDRLIWLDSDCVIRKTFDHDILAEIAPDSVVSSHFEVKHHIDDKVWHSCETGFFVLNPRHPDFHKFHDTYRDIYINDQHHGLRRFYDGEVYGETVRRLKSLGVGMLDLSPQWRNHLTPIKRSVLAEYISHFKGKNTKQALVSL